MEQSSIEDLRNWVAELAAHYDWDTGTTEAGDWSFSTPGGVTVLVEPSPAADARALTFTAQVAPVSDATPRELLLALLMINGSTAAAPGAPVFGFAPLLRTITYSLHLRGTLDTWTGANFGLALQAFTHAADQVAASMADGSLVPAPDTPDAPGAGSSGPSAHALKPDFA